MPRAFRTIDLTVNEAADKTTRETDEALWSTTGATSPVWFEAAIR